jgi:hypothetical protein
MLSFIPSIILDYPVIPVACALVLVLIYTIYLHYRIRQLTKGNGGMSLESTIHTALAHAKEVQEENKLIREHAISLDTRVSHALRNAQTIRYKAFEVGGSNQSFSISLLNELGSGVVITSLHARDRISTFAKPIEKYKSTYDLTEEELSVIAEAKNAHAK